MSNLLEVKNATFAYDKENIFENLSFSVGSSQAFLIVGPNGCGKSTLIDNLLGMYNLKSGEIHIQDKNINEYKPKEIAKHLAYVPQSHEKSFGYEVIDVIAMGRTYATKMFSPPSKEEIKKAYEALELIGLEEYAHRQYTKLSGGELQLVMIARAIAQNAKLLIMDEPTAHLDFCHELNVLEVITNLIKEHDISVVMATHFLNQAYFLENAGVDTTVALMHDKNFKTIGKPSEALVPDKLENVFNIVSEIANDGEGQRKYILPLRTCRR